MKISFVVSAYNEEKNIIPCVSAIQAEIARTGVSSEIIVVDNASTDRTGEVARGHSIMVVNETRKGLSWARKAGYDASTGDIIAHIDADTRMPAGWLTTVYESFSGDPELLALSGPFYYYDAPWTIRTSTHFFYHIGYMFDWLNETLFKKGSLFQGGNYIVRRDAMERIGGYNTSIQFYGEDVDIGRRIRRIGKVVWTFRLPMHSSGRRIQKEGIATMAFKYGVNYLWTTFFGKPYNEVYKDIRL